MKLLHGNRNRFSTLITRLLLVSSLAGTLAACSMGQVVVRSSQVILDSGIVAMNRETDIDLAREAMPANLKLLEGMLIEDPENEQLLLYAAQGFYGYSYGFVDHEDRDRAKVLYRRCYGYGRDALRLAGLSLDPATAFPNELQDAVAKLDQRAIPALFWSANCLGKWIDLNRSDPAGIAGLSNAAILMQRVLELDEAYYHAGPHMFFGVYYGGRAPMFGGDFDRAETHFRRANEINGEKLLLVDLLHAEYLDRQQLDRDEFNKRLTTIVEAPNDLFPEMALVNAIARKRAAHLLTFESQWF